MTTSSQQSCTSTVAAADVVAMATHRAAAVEQEIGAEPDGLHEVSDGHGEEIASCRTT